MEIAKTNTRGMSVEELRAVQKDCHHMSIECLDRMYAVRLDMNNLTHAAVMERDKWFKRHVKNGRESSRLYKLLRRRASCKKCTTQYNRNYQRERRGGYVKNSKDG